jgi:hypothetical protein
MTSRRQDPTKWRSWYNDRTWLKRRAAPLGKTPFCQDCEARGIVQLAQIVDHVEDHCGSWNEFITSPVRSLCRPCHERKHHRDLRPLYYDLDGWPVWATSDGQAPLPVPKKPRPENMAAQAARRRALVRSLIG